MLALYATFGKSGFLPDEFRMSAAIDKLAENLERYRAYLVKMKGDRPSIAAGAQGESVGISMGDSRVYDKDYRTILAKDRSTKAAHAGFLTSDLVATINRIEESLEAAGPYVPVKIDKLLVTDAEANDSSRLYKKQNERLKFVLEKAVFRSDVQLYRYDIGQHFGTYNYLWLLPTPNDQSSNREIESLRVLTKLKTDLPRHLSRKFHSKFSEKYSNVKGMTSSLRRDLLHTVCGDTSVGSHGDDDKRCDARLQLWLEADAEMAHEITVDLRRLNKSESHYDYFWEVMGKFLDEHDMKVNARRHGETCETPIAWSIKSLIKDIVEYASKHSTFRALKEEDIPSDKWVLLSFCPSNPWNKSAHAYQCRFDVRFKLLSRNAHSEHVDGEYAARILKHLRHLAVELKSKLGSGCVIFLHGDDKTSFKIGNPGDALAVVDRSKGSWTGKRSAQASQHDFASFKGNPSVWLVTDIPDLASESFYRGQVYGSVKDAVFRPSTPWRHAAEMNKEEELHLFKLELSYG